MKLVKVAQRRKVEKAQAPKEPTTPPYVKLLEDLVVKTTKQKALGSELEDLKKLVKKEVFPLKEVEGDPNTYTFGRESSLLSGCSVKFIPRESISFNEEVAEKILKAKRLYSKCLVTPTPPPPPKPYICQEKINELLSTGALTPGEVKKMLKRSRSSEAIQVKVPKSREKEILASK